MINRQFWKTLWCILTMRHDYELEFPDKSSLAWNLHCKNCNARRGMERR